jgi:dihydroneopterin aldolase
MRRATAPRRAAPFRLGPDAMSSGPVPLDRLRIRGIVCRCRIGVTEEERREPQRVEADLEIDADLTEAGRTGQIARTIDYRDLCDTVRGLLESGRFSLLESAASRTLDAVLERFAVPRAAVRLRKFVLPDVAHVEVRMERTRGR